MKKFELLSHTADIKIKAEASSLPELFEALLEGFCSVAYSDYYNYFKRDFEILKEIEVDSFDSTTHAVDFLSEVLSNMNIEKALFPKVEFSEINSHHSKSKIFGWKNDKFKKDIKAVTYHNAELLVSSDGIYSITILLDI